MHKRERYTLRRSVQALLSIDVFAEAETSIKKVEDIHHVFLKVVENSKDKREEVLQGILFLNSSSVPLHGCVKVLTPPKEW